MSRQRNHLWKSIIFAATRPTEASDRRLQSVAAEQLESRLFLSAAKPAPRVLSFPPHIPVSLKYPLGTTGPGSGTSGGTEQPFTGAAAASQVGGLTPAEVRGAYGLGQYNSSNITWGSIQGDGTGQTIAIVDAYNDPNIATDLQAFDASPTINLPNPPSFTVLNQNGLSSPLPTNSGTTGWSVEESLDVEWAHVMAPGASIVLFECNSTYDSDLYQGDITAAAYAGVSVVSNSFGGQEFSSESSYDSDFTTPAGHSGVTFLFSTGDTPAELEYPAQSPNVVAVGGTQLTISGNSWAGEVPWYFSSTEGTGGGTSEFESQPSFQAGTISGTTQRETPDISMAGGQNSGSSYSYVPICDSYDNGVGTAWSGEEGTSWSCPMTAGLVAVADQGRAAEGLTPLTGTQTLTRLYQLPKTNFHDVTSGSNGHAATVGYDEASGIGTPVANLLVPDLAGAGTVTGRVFADDLGNGVYGGNDVPLANQTVYLDLNNDGVLDNNEPFMTTNAQGIYTFTNEPAGGTVRLSSPTIAGYIALPVASAAIAYGSTDTINFTYFPTSFATSATATNYTLQSDSTGTYDQILINTTLSYSILKTVLGSTALSFSLTGTGDSFTADATYGNPIPNGGITLTGAASGDAVLVNGTQTLSDSYVVTSSGVNFDSTPFNFSNVSLLTLNPGNVASTLSVSSGSASIQAPRSGGGFLDRRFTSINVASGAKLLFPSAVAHSDRAVVAVSTLSDSGQIDLGQNDMILYGGTVGSLFPLLASGYNGGTWTGQGLASAAAATNTTHLTALGVLSNNSSSGTAIYGSLDNIPVNNSAILVKYTYYGDANLDGQVDGSDYSRIDFGHLTALTGWSNGDFNYDGSLNGTDYTLIDNADNTQGASLAAQISAAVKSTAAGNRKAATAVSIPAFPFAASPPITPDRQGACSLFLSWAATGGDEELTET